MKGWYYCIMLYSAITFILIYIANTPLWIVEEYAYMSFMYHTTVINKDTYSIINIQVPHYYNI